MIEFVIQGDQLFVPLFAQVRQFVKVDAAQVTAPFKGGTRASRIHENAPH